jgi:hypothetical protein
VTSRLSLAECPFLAATLAMAFALVLPWAFSGPAEEGQAVEIASILPWAAPEPGVAAPALPVVRLAESAGPSGRVTQR